MENKEKILIVEDEFIVANDLKHTLIKGGYTIVGVASSVNRARSVMAAKKPDWVLLDITIKGKETGIDLAWELKANNIPFLFISANTSQSILEEVKKTHPYGFLVKPFRHRDLLIMLDIARYRHIVEKNNTASDATSELQPANFSEIIGKSPLLVDILKKICIVAPTGISVLITGESGTGKERIAQSIHENSARRDKPMIIVNCATLPISLVESELFGFEKGAFTGADSQRIGKFEQADGCTLFLDEVGELPLDAQIKLLRVLQEKEIERIGGKRPIKIDIRIIAATNRNLEREVAEGRFRLDLYYRLNVFPIELPPLRERVEDIPELSQHFLQRFCKATKRKISGFTPNVMEELKSYQWPGNIRELEHLIERTALLSERDEIATINLDHNNAELSFAAQQYGLQSLEENERNHILQVLRSCRGKISGVGGAAEILKIPPATVYYKMNKLGISQEHYSSEP